LIKTTLARFDARKNRLLDWHAHEVHALLTLPASPDRDTCLDWGRRAVASEMPVHT
jgi:hypothetical protein